MKPATHRASLLAAFHCTHPDLDSVDKALLGYLVVNGDFNTGKNARPGNFSLAEAASVSMSTMKRHLAKNIERGLIERTERGNGRTTASVYRICWESPYYPETSLNGELLTEKPGHLDDPVKPKNRPPKSVNRVTELAKPGHLERKPGHLDDPTPRSTTSTLNTLTSERENLSSYSQITIWLPDDMKAAQKRKGERAQIDALISEHGGAKFLAALKRYWELQDPSSKLNCKWTAFLENVEGWLVKVTPEELQEQARARFRKEHPEEYQKQIDESIERQTQEIIAQRDARRRASEMSIEDFLK